MSTSWFSYAICVLFLVKSSFASEQQCLRREYLDKHSGGDTFYSENRNFKISTSLSDIKFFADSNSNIVDFSSGEVNLIITESHGKSDLEISSRYVETIRGFARRKLSENSTSSYTISNCHAVFSMNYTKTPELQKTYEEIKEVFQSCFDQTICNNFYRMEEPDFLARNNIQPSFANRVVDIALNQMFGGNEKESFTIAIPNFSYVFDGTGAYNKTIKVSKGRIENLVEFKRMSDVNIISDPSSDNYTIFCSFGINKTNILVEEFEMDIYGEYKGPLKIEINDIRFDVNATLFESSIFELPAIDAIKLTQFVIAKINVIENPVYNNRLRLEINKMNRTVEIQIKNMIQKIILNQFGNFDEEKFLQTISKN